MKQNTQYSRSITTDPSNNGPYSNTTIRAVASSYLPLARDTTRSARSICIKRTNGGKTTTGNKRERETEGRKRCAQKSKGDKNAPTKSLKKPSPFDTNPVSPKNTKGHATSNAPLARPIPRFRRTRSHLQSRSHHHWRSLILMMGHGGAPWWQRIVVCELEFWRCHP